MWLDRFRSSPAPEPTGRVAADFQARATRFKLDLPISFLGDGTTREGQCVNVSSSGLLARFEKLPELWTEGQLELEAGAHLLSINARVARIQGSDVGFSFLVQGDHDRAAIDILIHSAADGPMIENDLS